MLAATDKSDHARPASDGQATGAGSDSRRVPEASGLGSPEGAISVARSATSTTPKSANERKPRIIPPFDELRYREQMKRHRDRWAAVVAERTGATMPEGCSLSCPSSCPRCKPFRQLRYAQGRMLSTAKRMTPRLEACCKDEVAVACACGMRGVKVRCRQRWVCKACQVAFSAKREPMVRDGLAQALGEAVASWGANGGHGQKPAIYLLTVSHRHTGDIAADLDVLSRAWRTFAKAMHREWGAAPYVGTWELTPGRCTECDGYADGKGGRRLCTCERPRPEGHLHLHVATVWTFRDWQRVRSLWLRACPSSFGIDIRPLEVRDKQNASKVISAARSAARYIAKYITKGADGPGYTPLLRADVCAAFYNRHSFATSHRFWLPENKCCRKCKARIHRVKTVEPWLFDTLVSANQERYWLQRARGPDDERPPPGEAFDWYGERAREVVAKSGARPKKSPNETKLSDLTLGNFAATTPDGKKNS